MYPNWLMFKKNQPVNREYSARGINPQSGMIEIYRIESIGYWV